MWQKWTENAKKTIYLAQLEAEKLGDNEVNTAHMLLGLMHTEESKAAEILKRMNVDTGQVAEEVHRVLLPREGAADQDMQLTNRSKRAIDLAYDEAHRLNDNFIGTEHLLVGLLKEEVGAGRVLLRLGIDSERAQEVVREMRSQSSGE